MFFLEEGWWRLHVEEAVRFAVEARVKGVGS
jgi:hypothetical protein